MDIDKWTADQCGINVIEAGISKRLLIESDKHPLDVWTMQDARCREIFWQWLIANDKITEKTIKTEFDNFVVKASHRTFKVNDINYWITGLGKDLEEADIRCITAIMMEADNG